MKRYLGCFARPASFIFSAVYPLLVVTASCYEYEGSCVMQWHASAERALKNMALGLEIQEDFEVFGGRDKAGCVDPTLWGGPDTMGSMDNGRSIIIIWNSARAQYRMYVLFERHC
jgi:hypothetical protein